MVILNNKLNSFDKEDKSTILKIIDTTFTKKSLTTFSTKTSSRLYKKTTAWGGFVKYFSSANFYFSRCDRIEY